MENLSESTPTSCGFTDTGFKIIWDIICAVKYVNEHYEKATTQSGSPLPFNALKIEKDTVFYQLKAAGDFLVLITDFEIDDGRNNQTAKGKHKAKAASTEPNVEMIRSTNWNRLGKYLQGLYEGLTPNFEMENLAKFLGSESVNYEDLVWEAALWDLSTKLQFIREVFWCYDKNHIRISQLRAQKSLSLQSCIEKLDVNSNRDLAKKMTDENLFTSLFFLRVCLLAHQDDTLKGYTGPKANIEDKKSAEKFVLKESCDYMVNLILRIRSLEWIDQSPISRGKNHYMMEFYHPKKKK
jgi:hypothetical protein